MTLGVAVGAVGAAVGLAVGGVGEALGLAVGASVEHAQLRPKDVQAALEAPFRMQFSQPGSHVGLAVGLMLTVGLPVGLAVGASVEHAQLRPKDVQAALEAPLRMQFSQAGSHVGLAAAGRTMD